MMDATMKNSSRSYTYHKISKLRPGMKQMNVIGIVSYFRPPALSRGTDYSCTVGLKDDSDHPLKCVLFNGDLTKLPTSCNIGDILCLRRGSVSMYAGNLQLLFNHISSWLLFQGDSDSPLCSSSNCTITNVETDRVRELREWLAALNALQASSPAPTTTNQLLPSSHHDNHTNIIKHPSPISTLTPSPNQPTPPPGVKKNFGLSLTALGALSPGKTNVAVCGVVQLFKAATRSKGKDYYSTIWLVDQTSPKQPVSCTVFSPTEQLLPKDIPIGCIVLLKGLKTNVYQGKIQALGHERTLIGVFPNVPSAPSPTNISEWYYLTPREAEVVQQLKAWSWQQSVLQLRTALSQIGVGHFFNTVCRVAAVHECAENNLTVLEVFDGTVPKLDCKRHDADQGNWITTRDTQLSVRYGVHICEVQLNALSTPMVVSPGDIVSLINMHAKPLTSSTDQDNLQVQLTVLPQHIDGAVKLLEGQQPADIVEFISSFSVPFGPFPEHRKPSNMCPEPLFEILNEESKQCATTEEVLTSSPGGVFVVEGVVTSIAHGPVEELSQLRCSMCRTRYATPRPDSPASPDSEVCVFCSDSEGVGPPVCYTYVFILCLQGESGTIEICVTAEEAERFLHDLPPVNLYTDVASRDRLLSVLYMITGGNDPFYVISTRVDYERPKVRCCVRAFTSIDGTTRFTLVDTVCRALV